MLPDEQPWFLKHLQRYTIPKSQNWPAHVGAYPPGKDGWQAPKEE